eukprot:scaffold26.g3353.t1
MAPPTNGALKAKLPEFPSRSVAVLLRRLFAACRYAAVAAAAWAAYRGGVVIHALHESGELAARAGAWRAALGDTPAPPAAWLAAAVAAVVLAAWAALAWVYLLDFECYRPPASYWEVSYQRFMDGSRASGVRGPRRGRFRFDPPQCGMVEARAEAEMVMFGAVAGLLEKTAMIINYFDMRSDIDSYNLGGMGCSAGVLAIGLARKLLRERGRGGYALVVSTENITQNWMGGSAMLLTNKRSELRRAKYGNTSSSTVWYSLAFVESVQGVARGDVVWQIGFGSGFKCNSVVWRALRPIKQMHWAWERIAGREGEAMQRMQRIAAETAAERVAKVAAASDLADAQAHLTAAAAAARGAAAAVANGRAGRTLRSGKVV